MMVVYITQQIIFNSETIDNTAECKSSLDSAYKLASTQSLNYYLFLYLKEEFKQLKYRNVIVV